MSYAYRNRKKTTTHERRKAHVLEQGISPRLQDKRDRLIDQEVQRLQRNRTRRSGGGRSLPRALSKLA